MSQYSKDKYILIIYNIVNVKYLLNIWRIDIL